MITNRKQLITSLLFVNKIIQTIENQVFYPIKMRYIENLVSCFYTIKNSCNFIEANPIYRYLTFLNQWFKLKTNIKYTLL
ncbi:hypothetical protein GCM10008015_05030 [Flavobacterium palustre]|uniref:Uncharacterized protein n=1 Tax=Flavobacterium palustre TaxID=1476463 RepID=A0ABQ1HAT3_9FLAO|nr:hypothetical protein GCM10008015_05030 [Flavobacterium palustre]